MQLSFVKRVLFGCSLIVGSTAQAALINEIRIDQPSTDNDEYFELIGSASESLNDLTYLVLGDGSSGDSGVIEAVVNLDGQSLDSNGLFVAAEATFSLAAANLTANLNFENSDNVTHLLVSGFNGSNGDDLDTDDDGTLDVTPWTSIEDSIALVETVDSGEQVYGDNRVGPDSTFVPGHVYRCGDSFEIGTFSPVGETDTPTVANPCPAVTRISEIRIDQPGSDVSEYVELSGLANASLDGLSYIVIGDGAGGSGVVESITDLSSSSFDASGLFVFAKSSFALGTADLVTTFSFENSDNVTHLLVSGFSGSNQQDLDTDDDGTLDVTPWIEIVDSVALVEDLDDEDGEAVYSDTQVGPDGSFVPAHIFLCDTGYQIGNFDPAENTDTPGAANSGCDNGGGGNEATDATIPQIQGNGDASPLVGTLVRTTGVVVADFQGGDELRGFFLQDLAGDGNISTSDGIYVFDPDGVDVNVGDEIEIVANVTEFNSLTELNNVESINVLSTGNEVSPTAVVLPETTNGELEQYEGMLVSIVADMTVSQTFFLGRYGQMTLASADDEGNAGRLFQPTNLFPALSAEALAQQEENARRILILDDGQDISGFGDNPVPVPYIGGPPPSVVRAGDMVSNLVGVLDYGRINSSSSNPGRDYRLHPTQAPVFTASNPREAVPAPTGGRINVASYNVLNYFNTIDQSPNRNTCGPNGNQGCRGADSDSEFARQQAKIVNAIVAMDADAIGLVEIENNGNGSSSAIQNLVDAINTELGEGTYAIASIDDAPLGGDAIAVGMIYKPATLTPVGTAATLNTGAFDQNLSGGRSRQPLAVSFEENATGERFTAVVNHFKSKGSPPSDSSDPNADQGDGQGNWNPRRTEAANDLAAWLASNPTGVNDADIFIIGDLNAYAKEDPILALADQGYTDLIEAFNGTSQYSFTFDGQAGYLDHALGSASALEQVAGVVEWHINTDEPPVIDYNEDFNPDGYYDDQPYRSSDHDPVIVGLNLGTPTFDADGDGVEDDQDLCADTPEGANVDRKGCSVSQSIARKGERFLPNNPRKYLRIARNEIRKGLRRDQITRREARRIYYEAVLIAFSSRP